MFHYFQQSKSHLLGFFKFEPFRMFLGLSIGVWMTLYRVWFLGFLSPFFGEGDGGEGDWGYETSINRKATI